jgi:hypothetical protein
MPEVGYRLGRVVRDPRITLCCLQLHGHPRTDLVRPNPLPHVIRHSDRWQKLADRWSPTEWWA